MDFLLDTHAFIWFMDGNSILPEKSKNAIISIKNNCYLSIASIWEIAIKVSIGNLNLTSDFNKIALFLEDNNIELLLGLRTQEERRPTRRNLKPLLFGIQ